MSKMITQYVKTWRRQAKLTDNISFDVIQFLEFWAFNYFF